MPGTPTYMAIKVVPKTRQLDREKRLQLGGEVADGLTRHYRPHQVQ